MERIRELKFKSDTGFNRVTWNMDEKGFRNPGSAKPTLSTPEPGGWNVLPGKFKVVITNGTDTDSTFVTVKADPRLGDRSNIIRAQRALLTRLRKHADRLTTGMDKLTEAETSIAKIQAQIKDVEGKEVDSLGKQAKKVTDSIKSIREFISGKTKTRQGYGDVRTITVINQFFEANATITAKMIEPGMQEEQQVKEAEELISQAIEKINRFFATDWLAFRKQVEQTPVKIFKEYKPI